jgi:Zn finger protein HypA/HybF involved in hydrogenase expression
MGHLRKPHAEHRAALTCQHCNAEYWTSNQMTNECPECGRRNFEIHGPEGHDD